MKDVNDYKNPIKKSQNEMKGMKGILKKWNERNPREILEKSHKGILEKTQNEMKGILEKWNERNPRENPE